jgi:hypothetical protein
MFNVQQPNFITQGVSPRRDVDYAMPARMWRQIQRLVWVALLGEQTTRPFWDQGLCRRPQKIDPSTASGEPPRPHELSCPQQLTPRSNKYGVLLLSFGSRSCLSLDYAYSNPLVSVPKNILSRLECDDVTEPVPSFKETWIECLGDFVRY